MCAGVSLVRLGRCGVLPVTGADWSACRASSLCSQSHRYDQFSEHNRISHAWLLLSFCRGREVSAQVLLSWPLNVTRPLTGCRFSALCGCAGQYERRAVRRVGIVRLNSAKTVTVHGGVEEHCPVSNRPASEQGAIAASTA